MAGPKRKIYRGDVSENNPEQIELPAAAAGIKPGMLVMQQPDKLAVHGGGNAYYYVANAPMHFDPLTYVYDAGETVFAYIPRSREVYLVRAAAGVTVEADAPLMSDGAGRVKAQG